MFSYLSIEQTLRFFAMLKGVNKSQINLVVESLMKSLLIYAYKDKKFKELRYISGYSYF